MFDPYRRWLDLPREHRPPTHYQLLGVDPGEQDPQTLEEAALRRINRIRPYQARYPQECTQLLTEISQALVTLTDPARRQEYDVGLGGSSASITRIEVTQTVLAEALPSPSKRRKRAEKVFRIGRVAAIVFRIRMRAPDGKKKRWREVRLFRSRGRGQGWDPTDRLELADLPVALRVLDLARRYLEEREAVVPWTRRCLDEPEA